MDGGRKSDHGGKNILAVTAFAFMSLFRVTSGEAVDNEREQGPHPLVPENILYFSLIKLILKL